MLKVSVMMPTYNRPGMIKQAVESYINQDYPNKELIIIDGASDTEYAKQYESEEFGIKVYRLEQNYKGHLDHGFEFTTGDIITMLHDDDMFYDNESLSHRMKPFNDNNDIEVIFTSWVTMDKFENKTSGVCDCGNVSLRALMQKEYIYYTTMAWRRSIHDRVPIMDNDYIVNYDTMFKLMCLFECNCMPVHAPTVLYRQHDTQESAISGRTGLTRLEVDRIKSKFRNLVNSYL